MTTINVNTIAPSGSTLTVGDSGDTIVALDEIKVNTVKDAGGNTLWVSNGSGTLSSVSGFGGALNLLSTQTASGSATISFTSGIDSTYKEYVFKFIISMLLLTKQVLLGKHLLMVDQVMV